ncbi:hypothetical protein [Marinobacter sp. ELB17]|jgi:L-alanine-DL-glutamate epimerase-like enolase superfamily enzyme|uniref:hypothetical protein n=1 Tax=Marinobacter sp. ELB17 TaxID=270374 RepID=UPI0000F3706D|nr:hypothetical protein [Marinobacter sp. ELB17]EAZ97912.1 hypothetical protein MELB17_13607 [Marinobacter sp. ELB17]
MSFNTLTPKARQYYLQDRITKTMDIAAASIAVGETIESMINARAEAGTENLDVINNDGLIGGLAAALRILNENQLETLGDLNEMVAGYWP